jgi:hypothetical protein
LDKPIAARTTIITGAFGSGKTEIAMTLAMLWVKESPLTLVDLDFVTPYFRSQDHREEMEAMGVRVVAPDPLSAALDSPALPAAAREAIVAPTGRTLVDLGGDPAGAIVIGQFAPYLTTYDCWAVVNFSRPTTPDPDAAAAVLRDIAAVTRLRITGLIANTHIGAFTTPADVLTGLEQLRVLSARISAPIVLLCAPAGISLPTTDIPQLPIHPRLRCPW